MQTNWRCHCGPAGIGGWHFAPRTASDLPRALTACRVIHPTEETWTRLESWIAPAADAGHRFGVTDLLIASLAADVDALVWSLDA
jgi:predicted nucleic acid-binding protein